MEGLRIGNKKTRFPVIQGGMGIGISLGRLAGTVAKEGGAGVISAAQIGFQEPDFEENTKEANRSGKNMRRRGKFHRTGLSALI